MFESWKKFTKSLADAAIQSNNIVSQTRHDIGKSDLVVEGQNQTTEFKKPSDLRDIQNAIGSTTRNAFSAAKVLEKMQKTITTSVNKRYSRLMPDLNGPPLEFNYISTEQIQQVKLTAGSELLKIYYTVWTTIHQSNVFNVQKANICSDKAALVWETTNKMCQTLTEIGVARGKVKYSMRSDLAGRWRDKDTLDANQHLSETLPELITLVQQATVAIDKLHEAMRLAEDKLVQLADAYDQSSICELYQAVRQEGQAYHCEKLENYMRKKDQYEHSLKMIQQDIYMQEMKMLAKKSAAYAQQHKIDMETFKRTGKYPDKSRMTVIESDMIIPPETNKESEQKPKIKTIADIDVTDLVNQEELDDFFNDDEAANELPSPSPSPSPSVG